MTDDDGRLTRTLRRIDEHIVTWVLAPLLFIAAALLFVGMLQTAGAVFAIAVYVAFALGAGIVPLIGYVARDDIPFLSPMLGAMCFKLGAMANGTNVLYQHANDTYEMRWADTDEYEPAGYWTRLAGARFGVTYERTKDAFGTAAKQYDLDALETATDADLPGDRVETEIERGGKRTYLDAKRARELLDEYPGVVYVAIGEKVAELRDSAGLEVAIRAHAQALAEFGGDSGEHSTNTMAIATFAFAVLGLAVGYTVLFGI